MEKTVMIKEDTQILLSTAKGILLTREPSKKWTDNNTLAQVLNEFCYNYADKIRVKRSKNAKKKAKH